MDNTFYIIFLFYSLIISSSLLTIISKNPIHSVLFMILTFINTSVFLIWLNITYLGLLLLIVYVGAIAVLFLFIVMMLNVKNIENNLTSDSYLWFFFLIIFLIQFFYYNFNILSNFDFNNIYSEVLNPVSIHEGSDLANEIYILKKIGIYLFSDYGELVIFSGVLLLISMVGCIFLISVKKGYSRRNQYNQLNRTDSLFNLHLN